VSVLGGIGGVELGADVAGNVLDGTHEIDVNLLGSSKK
jgi:hypothetical protein